MCLTSFDRKTDVLCMHANENGCGWDGLLKFSKKEDGKKIFREKSEQLTRLVRRPRGWNWMRQGGPKCLCCLMRPSRPNDKLWMLALTVVFLAWHFLMHVQSPLALRRYASGPREVTLFPLPDDWHSLSAISHRT